MTKELIEKNKEEAKKILLKLGRNLLEVNYSGSGDSGAIDNVDFDNDDADGTFTYHQEVQVKGPDGNYYKTISSQQKSAVEFIEHFAYDLLESEHGGWEIDGGATGRFEFQLDDPDDDLVIVLSHTSIYTETDHREYDL